MRHLGDAMHVQLNFTPKRFSALHMQPTAIISE